MRTPHDPLLRELFSGDEVDEVRDRSLQQLVQLAGRRRRRRRKMNAALLICVPPLIVAAWFALVSERHFGVPELATQREGSAPVQSVEGVSDGSTDGRTPVLYMSDDDLLTLFPDRPAALVGRSGSQTFLFLDQQPWR